MKLTLQEPWSSQYLTGYLYVVKNGKAQGRAIVSLVRPDGTRRFTTYSRYLKAIELGHEVPSNLEVDHVDHDKTNDDPKNLQVLSKEANRLKELIRQLEEQDCYGVTCPYCTVSFLITERQRKMKLAQGVEQPFCSRKCSISYHKNITGRMPSAAKSSDVIDKIRKLRASGRTSYQISDELAISRNTVMKYW